jgi:hypothetical protein
MGKQWVRSYDQMVQTARKLVNETPGGRYEYADGMAELIATAFTEDAGDVLCDILTSEREGSADQHKPYDTGMPVAGSEKWKKIRAIRTNTDG